MTRITRTLAASATALALLIAPLPSQSTEAFSGGTNL